MLARIDPRCVAQVSSLESRGSSGHHSGPKRKGRLVIMLIKNVHYIYVQIDIFNFSVLASLWDLMSFGHVPGEKTRQIDVSSCLPEVGAVHEARIAPTTMQGGAITTRLARRPAACLCARGFSKGIIDVRCTQDTVIC